MSVQNSEYQLIFTRSARKEAIGLPPKISDQIERATDRLLQAFQSGMRPQDMKPIKGRPGTYRVDSGEYRILFDLDEVAKAIIVIRIRHRKDVYRNL